MKYQLLLKDVSKYTERAGQQAAMEQLRGALQVMHDIPKAANDMMSVSRLQDFEVSLRLLGEFKRHIKKRSLICLSPFLFSHISKKVSCWAFLG